MTESSHLEPPGAPTEGAAAAIPGGGAPAAPGQAQTGSRRPRRHRRWPDGGSSVRRWGWELFGWAVLGLGVGLVASATVGTLVAGELGSILSRLVLWVALAATIVLGFARSVPRGLLGFRPVDVLYGVFFGLLLRLVQGWLELAAGGSGAWPSYPSLAGQLPPGWAFDELLTGVVIAPVLEELFFRGVVLVALYTAVRRLAGRGVAMFASALVSAALFVIAHGTLAPLTGDAVVSLGLVGLTASLLVLLTGRIWGAVLVHAVYNAVWIALASVGTLLAV